VQPLSDDELEVLTRLSMWLERVRGVLTLFQDSRQNPDDALQGLATRTYVALVHDLHEEHGFIERFVRTTSLSAAEEQWYRPAVARTLDHLRPIGDSDSRSHMHAALFRAAGELSRAIAMLRRED
jgi:hypothetical protein